MRGSQPGTMGTRTTAVSSLNRGRYLAVLDPGGKRNECQRPALLIGDVGDVGPEGQRLADKDRAMVGEALLAMEKPADIDVQLRQEVERVVAIHHLQTEQVGGRDRCFRETLRRGVSASFARLLERLAEETTPAPLDIGRHWRKGVADGGAVDHGSRPLVKRDDAGAAKPEIVLERNASPLGLGRAGGAAKLPRQFITLGQPRRS